nr:hypothetical protein [Paramuribaculum intestinale]
MEVAYGSDIEYIGDGTKRIIRECRNGYIAGSAFNRKKNICQRVSSKQKQRPHYQSADYRRLYGNPFRRFHALKVTVTVVETYNRLCFLGY